MTGAPDTKRSIAATTRPRHPVLAVTIGDVGGIGPEVTVRAVTDHQVRSSLLSLVIGHPEIVRSALAISGSGFDCRVLNELPESAERLREVLEESQKNGAFVGWNPAGNEALVAPRRAVSAVAGAAAFQYLTEAVRLTRTGCVDAICTAPLNKESLHLAGHNFPGHTEILASQTGIDCFAMMLHLTETQMAPWRQLIRTGRAQGTVEPHGAAESGLSIAHATLHTSIADVPRLLTTAGIIEKIELMDGFLQTIGCRRRSIGVCALNPHAGEHSIFGDEESRVISPAVTATRSMGRNVAGPFPVDTLMRRAFVGEFDGLIAMYHDQGHIPVKLIGFNSAVNITLGLPIVRTSPTHGTAYDRAWDPATPADPGGMIAALLMAGQLAAFLLDSLAAHSGCAASDRVVRLPEPDGSRIHRS